MLPIRARRTALAVLALVATVLSGVPALATTVIPLTDEALVRDALAIVLGRVQRIETHWDPAQGQIFTHVTLALDEVLKGELPVTEVTVRQVGGTVGGVHSWIEGSPEFRRGERVLVFLAQNSDGTLRVAHLYQGKFSVHRDPSSGEELLERDERPGGVNVLGAVPPAPRRLERLKATIRAHVGSARARRPALPLVTEAVAPSDATVQTQASFTYLGSPSRWFEPDGGQPIGVRINASGEPLAPGLGFSEVRAGYSAWNAIASSTARFRDDGTTTAVGYQMDGVSAVSFRDPLGQIDPPSGCAGTLAISGYFRTSETRIVNGQSFSRIIESDVVFADGWAGCGFYERSANFTEVAGHELGHVLGLGHSTDPTALMYAYAHFDGRGARLASDDIAGVTSIYPAGVAAGGTLSVVKTGTGTGTVSSAPAGITCGTDCSQAYASGTVVTLTAAAAAGSTFGGWSGGGCTGTSTCQVTLTGATTVTATFTASTTTALTAAFGTPAPGATLRGAVSIGMKTSARGTVKTLTLSIDGRVVMKLRTTGTTAWYSWNTRTVTNGAHTLRLTVTDAAGATAAATQSVTVKN